MYQFTQALSWVLQQQHPAYLQQLLFLYYKLFLFISNETGLVHWKLVSILHGFVLGIKKSGTCVLAAVVYIYQQLYIYSCWGIYIPAAVVDWGAFLCQQILTNSFFVFSVKLELILGLGQSNAIISKLQWRLAIMEVVTTKFQLQ
eukprot:TRINITY_DN13585_c0_g1_i6.p3 TRINITY_DN13585_c0_g1~~TRINITY_DN13585_c0_g1_i6.p3  ORF type:complete len:145 (-),score=2.47 TRINITY_DN13585_c0_g1_i6:334-768(-)